MWHQLVKMAARLAGVKVLTLSAFGDALAALRYQYPNQLDVLDKLSTLPVIVIDSDKWERYGLDGSGYLVRLGDVRQTEGQLKMYGIDVEAEEKAGFMWGGNSGFERDFNIYKIWKEGLAGKDSDFILIRDDSPDVLTASVMHEVSHVLGGLNGEKGIGSGEWRDAKDYFGATSERESYKSEMGFFKGQGKSFAYYVAKAHPKLYEYWKVIKEVGKDALDKELYDDVVADLNDYKMIWDKV